MGNNRNRQSVFRFKQFSVEDTRSAMKVGTDGVLLGAWADVSDAHRILDVGSGCGLISLMMAQRSSASVVGVEIDPAAVLDSQINIEHSPWHNRVSVLEADFNSFIQSNATNAKFDHIVSNPPFFASGPVAPDRTRATARHSENLSYEMLILSSSVLLSKNGRLSLISPVERKPDIEFAVELSKMYVTRLTEVSSCIGKSPVRLLWEISVNNADLLLGRIAIKDSNGRYTSEYIELTRDFYLNM